MKNLLSFKLLQHFNYKYNEVYTQEFVCFTV